MKPEVEAKFAAYPPRVRKRLRELRRMILDVAAENGLGPVEETLKWGEPSYLVKGGSTVRIDWKAKQPEVIPLAGTLCDRTLKHCIELSLKYHSQKHLPLLGA